MTPLRAMQDAYDDLRSHQFGVMAGMQAALAGVLARFNPEELQNRLTQKTVIEALIPAQRKARLWDLFTEHYGAIQKEAQDDFDTLFGKAFLKAYEAQIAKLRAKEGGQ
jgi:FHA domain-containing protein